MDFRAELAKLLSDIPNVEDLIEVPPDYSLGDYAVPCFSLVKKLGKSPAEIASDFANKISADWIEKVETKGPYLNIFVKPSHLVEEAHHKISFPQACKKVAIELSSPNIAKPFGIGHLRSTVIGAALARAYSFAGWDVVKLNHIGDWGTQFGKLIVAYKKWPTDLSENPIEKLLDLYVKFHKEAELHPELEDEARLEFKKLEQGDEENRKLWEEFRKLSLEDFNRVYKIMGVEFDNMDGEAFYQDKMQPVIDELKEKNLLVESEGAQIVEFDDKTISAPAIILKSDGATMYITRDLAAAIYRKKTYDFNKLLYEVGAEQQLHFRQLFAALKKMGYDWATNCEHVWHGLYRFPEGKMSTRKGQTIFIEDVFSQAVEKTLSTINEKNPDLADKETVAEKVGIGAIVFNDLKNDRIRDIQFDWSEILDFEGESGPYLMYTHARLRSILRKSSESPKANPSLLKSESEVSLARHILKLKEIIRQVLENNTPHTLSHWLLDLAQLTNSYYQKERVIQEDKELEAARLALIEVCADNLKTGLNILGLHAPEEM